MSFQKFTNCYPLIKTLRWELKPIWQTMEYIKKEAWILWDDTKREENYKKIKPILDKLHNDFIEQSLSKSTISWSDFFVFYTKYKKKLQTKTSIDKKELENIEKEFENLKKDMRKQVWNLYVGTANERKIRYTDEKWKELLKENWFQILTEAWIQKVLKQIYKYDENVLNVINDFDGFWTYFGGFNINRENYYTTDGKSTEIAFRIVDQNLLTFCNNISLQEKIEQIWLNDDEKQIFDTAFYNQCLTQEWINTYNYILGGEIDENGKRISDGINQRVNQYNQKNKIKIPQMTILYKQIGSLQMKWKIFESIDDDEVLYKIIDEYLIFCDTRLPCIQKTISDFFSSLDDLDKIWISEANLSRISNKFFSSRSTIKDTWCKLGIFKTTKDRETKEEKTILPKYISLENLKQILENTRIEDQGQIEEEKRIYLFKKELEEKRNGEDNNWLFFIQLFQEYRTNIFDENNEENKLFWYEKSKEDLIKIQNSFDKNNQEHKTIIKNFADKSIEVLRFIKIFRVDTSKRVEEISDFNKEIDVLIQDFDVTRFYDLIRNYLTKKPFSIEKMKLNFDCSTLLAWRDKNKETQNHSVILKDESGFYIAIMRKDKNNLFEEEKNSILFKTKWNEETIQKMEYKFFPDVSKMIPKCSTQLKKVKEFFKNWWNEIRIFDKKTFDKEIYINDMIYKLNNKLYDKKNTNNYFISYDKDDKKDYIKQFQKDYLRLSSDETWYKRALTTRINFCKIFVSSYKSTSVFDYSKLKESTKYNSLDEFYEELDNVWYKLSRTNLNKQELMKSVESGQIYLFQISSKDFTKKNKDSKQDLQTIYWTNMLSGNSTIKLNGWAEIFFRPPSIKDKKIKKLKIENTQAIENKRYTEEKILFHCPITLNFWSKKITKFNDYTNDYIKQSDVNIIGIDRWEKHLNFYSVINPQGEILEQGTLNIFETKYKDKDGNEKIKVVDYEKLLSDKAGERLSARQNRETIGKIKELKEWYISQVVKKIADLVLKYNAVVVLENLNSGFKNSRKKIEQSVYQNLEVALAKKLSFLVDKNKKTWEIWSVTNAYQLLEEIKQYSRPSDSRGWWYIEWRSQIWVMFYTRANYTSTTDPITGWRKTIYLKKWNVEDMKKGIEESFAEIGFDNSKQAYFIKYSKRTLWSNVERRRWTKNNHWERIVKKYNPTQEFDKLLEKNWITKNTAILEQIKNKSDMSSSFFGGLLWIIDLIMQIRNSDTEKNDVILSCVEDKNWKKFDSREYYKMTDQEKTNTVKLPTSWDANGAYNIARKGLMMVERIKKWETTLYISDIDRDSFSQK